MLLSDDADGSGPATVLVMPSGLVIQSTSRSRSKKSYFQALEAARNNGAKSLLELRAATNLAQFWCDRGKRAEAHDLLAPVYSWFTEGFDTPDLRDAKQLLDELR